jgi:hypothetical protein
MAGTRAKALARCKQPMGTGATAVMQQSADKGQTGFRPSSIPRSCMARKCGTRRRRSKRQDVSGRKKALRSILALHPETALLTFCTGTLGYFHPVYSLMLPNCLAAGL